jgi:hypothetical protein
MGAWGKLAFDNDEANDWASDLEWSNDLSLVELAFKRIEDRRDEDVDPHLACDALAACEVLARLQGNHGYKNAYTEQVDEWVAAHPLTPSSTLLRRAEAVIARILGEGSELRQLWDGDRDWHEAVDDLRKRVVG